MSDVYRKIVEEMLEDGRLSEADIISRIEVPERQVSMLHNLLCTKSHDLGADDKCKFYDRDGEEIRKWWHDATIKVYKILNISPSNEDRFDAVLGDINKVVNVMEQGFGSAPLITAMILIRHKAVPMKFSTQLLDLFLSVPHDV